MNWNYINSIYIYERREWIKKVNEKKTTSSNEAKKYQSSYAWTKLKFWIDFGFENCFRICTNEKKSQIK